MKSEWMQEIELERLTTTDREGGPHQFWCSVRESPNEWCVWVWASRDIRQEHYFARFVALGDDFLQTDALENHEQRWALRKGISEAVFALIHERSGRPIISSRSWREGEGEWRTDLATAMWRRFVREGMAAPLLGLDRFVFPATARERARARLERGPT